MYAMDDGRHGQSEDVQGTEAEIIIGANDRWYDASLNSI